MGLGIRTREDLIRLLLLRGDLYANGDLAWFMYRRGLFGPSTPRVEEALASLSRLAAAMESMNMFT